MKMLDDCISFGLQVKEEKARIRLFLSYLKDSKEKSSLSFRDFDLMEEILNTASCYGINLEREGMIKKEELIMINEETFESVGRIGRKRYDDIRSRIEDHSIFRPN
jgi:hypothetical protein